MSNKLLKTLTHLIICTIMMAEKHERVTFFSGLLVTQNHFMIEINAIFPALFFLNSHYTRHISISIYRAKLALGNNALPERRASTPLSQRVAFGLSDNEDRSASGMPLDYWLKRQRS
ncbi:MAG TPA: hypothetical protein ENK78_05935 [Thiothrix sp.]|nr:hypothetical protein [Thiothrix sp.]